MTEFPAGSPLPGTGPARSEPLTVAQLVARQTDGTAATVHTPVARETGALASLPQLVSVGSLLRREGRAPHALDRPMQPRAVRQAEMAPAWPARPTAGRRRAAAVAGALLATGSVLGAALYNGAASHSSDAQAAADGLFPGLGLPTGGAAAGPTLPPGYLPANVSLTSPLPAESVLRPGATDWMRVAFPGHVAAPGSAATGTLRNAATMPAPLGSAIPAAGSAAQNTPSAGGAGGPSGGSGGSGGILPALTPPDRAPAGNLLDPLTGAGGGSAGGTVGGPGGAPGPSAGAGTGPLQNVTEVARPLGEAVGGVVQPVTRAAAPVGETVGGVLTPVTSAAKPLTTTLSSVTKPVNDTLEPVTTPVLGALQPVTQPVLKATAPVTDPVLKAAKPVTDLLNTSAATGEQKSGSSGKHRAVKDGGSATTPVTDLVGGLGTTVGSLTGAKKASAPDDDSGSPRSSGSPATSRSSASESGPGESSSSSPKAVTETVTDTASSTVGSLTRTLGGFTGAQED